MTNIQRINFRLIYIIIASFLFTVWGEREIFVVGTGIGNRILQLVYTLCMVTFQSMLIWYLLKYPNESGISMKKYYLLLLIIQTIAFLPMYTQNFLYGDDLWLFMYDFDGQINRGVALSRPFAHFLRGSVLSTSFLYIKYFRIYNSLVLFLFGCVMLKYLISVTQNKNLAMIIVSMMTCSCVAVDCIAYASVYPINISLLLSAVGFIAYDMAKTNVHKKKVIFYLISCICLFSAFCMYQIGTPIFFVMYIIREKYNEGFKQEIKRLTHFVYILIFYASVAITYLLGTKFFQYITGVDSEQNSRGQIISSIFAVILKIGWFLLIVIPQSMTKVVAGLFGNTLFNENNMFYQCHYAMISIAVLMSVVILLLMCISIIGNTLKKKSVVYFLIAMILFPLSFWPFLVLPEYTYMTYYAMPIILLIMWYVCDGIYLLYNKISNRINDKGQQAANIVMILIFVIVLQSNYYAENAWVNYNRDSYEYLANSIAAGIDSLKTGDTIMIEGNIGPKVGGREYVIFAVQDILIELEHNPNDFTIMQTDNPYYISMFDDVEAEEMRQILGEQSMDELLQYYLHTDMYSEWLWADKEGAEEAYEFLHECFVKTGQLPKNEEDTLIINMKGFNDRNSF